VTTKTALRTFLFWVGVALATNVFIYVYFGHFYVREGATAPDSAWALTLATEFFGAWAMEQTLSLDNLFMFYFIFAAFRTPPEARHKVLKWGIIGVIAMRGAIILGGTALIHQFWWILPFFALFLLWAAAKIFFFEDKGEETEEAQQSALENNWLVRVASKVIKFEKRYDGDKFFTTVNGERRATLLLLVVLVVEGTDVPFAFDSLPAAMAISQNFYIVASSNLLAVMGLRAIYFLIENMRERFAYMQQGIGILLAFAGLKILLKEAGPIVHSTVGLFYPQIGDTIPADLSLDPPKWISLGFIVVVIVTTIGYTLLRTSGQRPTPST